MQKKRTIEEEDPNRMQDYSSYVHLRMQKNMLMMLATVIIARKFLPPNAIRIPMCQRLYDLSPMKYDKPDYMLTAVPPRSAVNTPRETSITRPPV